MQLHREKRSKFKKKTLLEIIPIFTTTTKKYKNKPRKRINCRISKNSVEAIHGVLLLKIFHLTGEDCVLNSPETPGASTPLIQVRSDTDDNVIQSALASRRRPLSSRIRELNRELLLDNDYEYEHEDS